MRYRIVSMDFDHTLTAKKTAIEHFAASVGRLDEIAALEAAFRARELTTREFSDRTAHMFAGTRADIVDETASKISLLAGSDDLVKELVSLGVTVIINTVGYEPLLRNFKKRTGCADVSGVLLACVGNIYTGSVQKYFAIEDKIHFAADAASRIGCGLGDVLAVGDGLSDLPLFRAAGHSIAFNADAITKASATSAVDGRDVRPLRELLLNTIFEA